MSKKAVKDEVKSDHVVIAVRRRGLDRIVNLFGPFTKAKAYVYAQHRAMYEGDECSVERMEYPCDHNKWIFEGV